MENDHLGVRLCFGSDFMIHSCKARHGTFLPILQPPGLFCRVVRARSKHACSLDSIEIHIDAKFFFPELVVDRHELLGVHA